MKVGLNNSMKALLCRFLFLLLLSFPCLSMAQEKVMVKILHADSFKPIIRDSVNITKFIGSVRLRHSDMFMSCDSLLQYQDSNYVKAYGHIYIEQIEVDTMKLWGDYMLYDMSTSVAKIRGNVIMKDALMTVETNHLDYDADKKIGNYFNGGVVTDTANNKITSIKGYYYQSEDKVSFRRKVRVHTKEYRMHTDTLDYNMFNKQINVLGPTWIYGENRKIYTELGWYNAITAHSELYKNNKIYYDEHKAQADTIIVDSVTSTAFMKRNIRIKDSINNIMVEGNKGWVFKDRNLAFITDRALLTMIGDKDSLYVRGDTISFSKDSLDRDILRTYRNTRFYNKDLSGVCDSMNFYSKDSIIKLYGKPIVWAGINQMTAVRIDLEIVNNNVDKFVLDKNAMIISKIDSLSFNQIKGNNIKGYMKNRDIHKVFVDGSAETIYYPDDKGIIIALHRAAASQITIGLSKRKVMSISYTGKTDGDMKPIIMVKPEERKLRGFIWKIDVKPNSKQDLFLKPISKGRVLLEERKSFTKKILVSN